MSTARSMKWEMFLRQKEPGTGGVHISGRTGVPVSLDKEEYTELGSEPEAPAITEKAAERDIRPGDIVRHFKREWVNENTSEYLYKVLAFADHTETGEKICSLSGIVCTFLKPAQDLFEMFMSEVDRDKYPDVKQKWRFEKVEISIIM